MSAGAVTVGELSEAALLARILPRMVSAPALLGPGDDAAVIAAPDGRVVFSVDTLVQDQDFRTLWPNGYRSTGFDIGWKSAAQNLSDINAMGAVPTALVVSLTLPPGTPVGWAEGVADGLAAAVKELGASRCTLAGGDLGRGRELSITAAVTGDLQGRAPVLRSGARAGDLLAVGGTLGRAAAGLALLEHGPDVGSLDAGLGALIGAQARPLPPLALGPAAAAAGASAMMDISDGLVRDAGRLAAASGVDAALSSAALAPFARGLRRAAALLDARRAGPDAAGRAPMHWDPMHWVLGGGEDHGLLAAFPAGVPLPAGFTQVGVMAAAAAPGDPGVTVDGGVPVVRGWDHFGSVTA